MGFRAMAVRAYEIQYRAKQEEARKRFVQKWGADPGEVQVLDALREQFIVDGVHLRAHYTANGGHWRWEVLTGEDWVEVHTIEDVGKVLSQEGRS